MRGFRGKRLDNSEWAYGDLINCSSGKKYIFPTGNYANEENKVGFEGCLKLNTFEIDPGTIGQYTGLKGKSGKEIYEGDILKYTFDLPGSSYATENGLKIRIDKVFWSDFRVSFALGNEMRNHDLFRYVRNGNRVEIIGNIHDNPKLLEVEV